MEARPKAAAQAREAVNWTLTILDTWAAERPEINEEERAKVSGMCANFFINRCNPSHLLRLVVVVAVPTDTFNINTMADAQ